MEKFTVVTGIAAPMMMPNINTDAMTPMAAGRSTATDLGIDAVRQLALPTRRRRDPEASSSTGAPFRHSAIHRRRREFRLRQLARARGVGADALRHPLRDRAELRRHLPRQRVSERTAAGRHWTRKIAQRWAPHSKHAAEPLVTVDLQRCVVRGPDGATTSFSVPAERRMALLEGLDEIDVILRMEADIDAFQRADREQRPWIYLDRP